MLKKHYLLWRQAYIERKAGRLWAKKTRINRARKNVAIKKDGMAYIRLVQREIEVDKRLHHYNQKLEEVRKALAA